MEKTFKWIANNFIKGVIFIVPAAATIYVIIKLLAYIDGLIPIDIPGLGLLTLIASLTLFGLIASTILVKPFSFLGKELLERAPIVKSIYDSIKDLLTAFVGQKRKFDKPVMVQLTKDSNIRKLGFLTNEDLAVIGIEGSMVSVYLPHSYAFSGNLFIVPAENVTKLDASAAQVMKFIVTGGATSSEEPAD